MATASFNLSDLDGSNGFALNGTNENDRSGRSVSGTGDINGDGIDDLIIGAPGADPNGGSSGQSYVVFGSSEEFPASLELASLNGSNGFTLNGINARDVSGFSVSGAGDINDDGIDDLIVGAPTATPNDPYSGQSYVVFGSPEGFPASLELTDLDGSNGFTLNGINRNDYSGFSVRGAGDINGDGIDDLIVGAREASPNGRSSGQSYVVFGSSEEFPASLELADLDGSNGFALNGINPDDVSGNSVSGAGDVNGDGIDDLIVGAPGADPNGGSSGQSYVVFGSSEEFPASLELASLNGSNGFALNGINAGDDSGYSVSGAGDINGDGIDDLIVGAYRAGPNGFRSGQSYVVFGSPEGFPASLELASLNGSNGFALNGINPNDYSGRPVSGAGDVNGDGIDDLIIVASGADPNGPSSGQSYVVFGSPEGFPASLELVSLNGSNGFALNGFEGSSSASGAGDINGDGIDDLIIGASGADPNGVNGAGQSYVVFGGTIEFPEPALFTVTNTNDSGAGSLRQAILDANDSSPAADTIEFDPELSGQTIFLTSGELQITDDLTINGLGAENLTVSGNNASRVFNVDDGTPDELEVFIDGLTIADGSTNGNGGGISNRENLTVTDSSIAGNNARLGGGIYNENFTELIDTKITGNTAALTGGGVFNAENSTFINNNPDNIFSNIPNDVASNPVTFSVTNLNDSGSGSLRQAIEEANAVPGADTIEFDPELSGQTIFLTSGELQITDDLTINGLGADELTVSGNNASRVFNVDDGTFDELEVVIDGLTIADGSTNGNGGGISNNENLTLTDNTISGNTAEEEGGGIFSRDGDLTVTNSTISNNIAQRSGGGIFSVSSLEVTNSTISDNTAQTNGGGIYNGRDRDLTVTNSTISNNTASGERSFDGGGGIFNNSSLEVTDSTISGNTAEQGGGIYNGYYASIPPNNTTVANSIIAKNTDEKDIGGEALFTSQGFNLIGNGDGASGFTDGVNGDQVGTSANPIDPKLGPLQDNGGPTETQALLPGSPAIDAGNPDFIPPPDFDQRGPGFPRVLDGDGDGIAILDIGAFETGKPGKAGVIKIEAEDLDLDNYRIENNSFASGGALISLKGASKDTGTASTTFTGQSGLYDIVVGYFDEADGDALLRFRVNHDPIDNWSLNQNLRSNVANDKTFQQRTIGGVELEMGDTLTIEGTRDVRGFPAEFARVDFLKFLPRSVFDVDSGSMTAVSGNDTMA